MTSEHHGGFAGYLPNPLQVAAFILEETASGWVAACPVLLPLRPVAQLAEEVAWLGIRHPGRVGLGVAAGALPLDFEAMGLAVRVRPPLHRRSPRIVDMLEGRDLRQLDGDRALQACARTPIPVLSAAASPPAARRAAGCGAGILTEGMSTVGRLRRICDAYDDAGGRRPKVIIRRVWLCAPDHAHRAPTGRVRQLCSSGSRFSDDQTITADDPRELARLSATWLDAGAEPSICGCTSRGSPGGGPPQVTVLTEECPPSKLSELIDHGAS